MIRRTIPAWIAAIALAIVPAASAFQAEDTTKATTKKTRKSKRTKDTTSTTESATTVTAAKAAATPTKIVPDSDIAAAKASGKVWVNTETGVYHKGGQWYGATKQGKFMSEEDAIKAGYRVSKTK